MTPTEFEIWWIQFSQYAHTLYAGVSLIVCVVVSAVGVFLMEEKDL
jgi:hypothetical protein